MDPLKAEVMVLLDTIQAAKMGGEKPSPMSGRHDGLAILCTDQQAEITCRRLIDYMSQIIQRADIGGAKLSLDVAKTGIRREHGVASNQKMKPDGVVIEWCSPKHNSGLHHPLRKCSLLYIYISALCMRIIVYLHLFLFFLNYYS